MNQDHGEVLLRGVAAWNEWRRTNPDIRPDLTGADLTGDGLAQLQRRTPILEFFESGPPDAPSENFVVDLKGADFSRTLLTNANLAGVHLSGASLAAARMSSAVLTHAFLENTNLDDADLERTDFWGARMNDATLVNAQLRKADLTDVNLSGADLTNADLREVRLVGTDLRHATLVGCQVWGAAIWGVQLAGARQSALNAGSIIVDDLSLASFVHLLLNSDVRSTIEVITRRMVLLLGRFSTERKPVLDMLRVELSTRGYTPVIFDFDAPTARSLTETVSTLAHLSRFVVADITDAKSVPQELQKIVPDLLSVPVVPLLLGGSDAYAMFDDFARYPQMLALRQYADAQQLREHLLEWVIDPAEAKADEMEAQLPLTVPAIEIVLDAILPPANKDPWDEHYDKLLTDLKAAGIRRRADLINLLRTHKNAILTIDSREVKRLLAQDPESWEDSGVTGERLGAGAFFSHTALAGRALSLELERRQAGPQLR